MLAGSHRDYQLCVRFEFRAVQMIRFLNLFRRRMVGATVAVQVELDSYPLFAHFMDGTGAGNVDWINKKKNVTRRFGRSSWAVRLEFLERNADFQKETGLDPELFRAEGGAVPLVVSGKGRVGTLTVSGLHGYEDHALAVGGLQRWMNEAKGRDVVRDAVRRDKDPPGPRRRVA